MAILKQGDTHSPLTGTIYQADGKTPLDLTGCSLTITIASVADEVIVDAKAATIVSPTAGTWSYALSSTEAGTSGKYRAELEITFPDGTVAHCPTEGFLPLEILATL